MSLIGATVFVALATTVLAVGAIVTAVFAILAYLEQRRQVRHLLEESARADLDRRRAQAARVFTCVPSQPPYLTSPYAKNTSESPVYSAQFWYTGADGLTGPEDLGMITPGGTVPEVILRRFPEADALKNTILTFRDANGVRWIRMPDGTLSEQTRGTAQLSILTVLGQALPAPADPPGLTETAGGAPEAPRAP